jgi:hypothetical protein
MEQNQSSKEELENELATESPNPGNIIAPTLESNKTCGCGGMAPNPNSRMIETSSYVYAIGRIQPRFPRPSIEKEFAQATGRAETTGLTDREATKFCQKNRIVT